MNKEQKIAILTDSCADLSREDIEKHDIYVVPLHINCSDGDYSDGVDICAKDIYKRLAAGEIPKTSQPSVDDVSSAFDRISADGYTRVIAYMISSGLSGTYNLVDRIASERSDMDIKVYDSHSGALGQGMTVLQIAEDIEKGMSWEELNDRRIPHLIKNTFAYFSVDTLEYLVKGGRIGKITAFAGMLLNIKPIISFDPEDGQLRSVAKVRGTAQVKSKLVELTIRDKGSAKLYNIAVENGGASEEMENLKKMMTSAMPEYINVRQGEIDGTLSTYIGSGVLGAAVQLLY